MEEKDKRVVGKCFGSTAVGPRGQLVIPAVARKELGIDVGTKLLVFSLFQEKGLILIKVDAVEELVNLISHHTDEVIKMLRNNKVEVTETENEGD